MPAADINMGRHEIFRIKKKTSPIKAHCYCDPEDAGRFDRELENPPPVYFMQPGDIWDICESAFNAIGNCVSAFNIGLPLFNKMARPRFISLVAGL